MTRTRLIIAALVLGTLAGLALCAAGSPALDAVAAAVLPLGQMWVRALQMTLIPLIFAMVTHGIASAVAGGNGSRWIGTTLSLFVVAMIVTVILCTILYWKNVYLRISFTIYVTGTLVVSAMLAYFGFH